MDILEIKLIKLFIKKKRLFNNFFKNNIFFFNIGFNYYSFKKKKFDFISILFFRVIGRIKDLLNYKPENIRII